MNTLSIDFGTSYCTASYLDEDRTPCPVCFGYNKYNAKCFKIPTVIQYALTPNGEERKIVGETALFNLAQSNHSDTSIVSKIKTELRENSGYIINGKPKKSSVIVSDILQNIKQIAENNTGRIFEDVILTHPAQYGASKTKLLEQAAFTCGFKSVSLLEEPKAAAYAFIKNNDIPSNKGAVVFDYGGGTIDIAYLWIESANNIQFKFSPVGKEQCGGEYIDLALHNHFYNSFYTDVLTQISTILLEHCNRIKIGFGFKEVQDLAINQNAITILRSDFNNIISEKVSIAINLLSDVIAKCNSNNYPIDYVFLNGGSSRLKCVRDSIEMLLPESKLLPYNEDDIAVAIGALLSKKDSIRSSSEGSAPLKVVGKSSAFDKIRERFKNS